MGGGGGCFHDADATAVCNAAPTELCDQCHIRAPAEDNGVRVMRQLQNSAVLRHDRIKQIGRREQRLKITQDATGDKDPQHVAAASLVKRRSDIIVESIVDSDRVVEI
jgi:hypothetical protein